MFAQTRREFLRTTVAAVGVLVTPIHDLAPAGAAVMKPHGGWDGGPGKARWRIDGLRKVTGEKIYARDFHARDMPGWPEEQRHVLVVRTTFTDRTFDGLDLEVLPGDLQPAQVITAEDLERDGTGVAEEYPAGRYLVRKGSAPDYLGQAAAIMLFDERAALERAKEILVFDNKGIRMGREVPVPPVSYFEPETSIIHVVEDGKDQKFAQTLGGPVHPEKPGQRNAEAMKYVNSISEKFASAGWDVHKGTYRTQVTDPMFMEPESGLGWFDRSTGVLNLLIGTQSPGYDVNAARALFAQKDCKIPVKNLHLHAAYPGGGFGGRDSSILCLFLAIAAAYSDRPVKLAYDRFQQFQAGIKRHASEIELTLAIDGTDKFQAIRNHTFLNGGGRINVSAYVADVAGVTGAGPYAFPLADIWSRPQHTHSPVAGSMRGFGSYQSTFAIESLVDEIAEKRGIDPIELRRANVLRSNEPIVTGAPVVPPGLMEICDRASGHRLWKERDAEKTKRSRGEWVYGVGFALGMKNYGSGADAVMAQVSIDPKGVVRVTTNSIDMGNGLATTMALAPAKGLGRNADEIQTGEVASFEKLELIESFTEQPYNPRWTPIIWNSTKASSGSSRWIHATEQASQVLLETAILPAARSIWGAAARNIREKDVTWADEKLTAGRFTPIPFSRLAREIHAKGLPCSAMVHAFFSGRWIEADYSINGTTRRWQIDALAIQKGGSEQYERIDRKNPRLFTVESMWQKDGQTFATAGALAAVRVNQGSGEVRVVEGVHYIAPGKVLQPDLVAGQMEGGWAMGVGHALLEELPPFQDGAVTGKWNLNRYHVALSGDCALHRVENVILPPESPDAPARGISEGNFTPVAPAIANAVAHATGRRFRELPITPERVRAARS